MAMHERMEQLRDAFAHPMSAAAEPPVYAEIPLREMAQTLTTLNETQWGRYAFSRDPLEGKFTGAQKDGYTAKAGECGREWAERIAAQYGTRRPQELLRAMRLKLKTPAVPIGGNQVLFDQFIQPDEITVFTDCIDKAADLAGESGCPLLERDALLDVLLAHEIFHAVEERHGNEIYTQTEKVELWHKPFSNRSSIACLSEIAGMAFAQALLDLPYSPYALDALLVYPYDKNAACGLYAEICELAELPLK